MNENKVKVLYITGSGRSGSTILQNILGQIDGYFSVGELRYVWERSFLKNKPCGCGLPFDECETWRNILEHDFNHFKHIEPFQLYRLTESFRLHQMPFTVIPGIRNGHLYRLNGYLDHVEKLYASIHCATGSRVIVDSSKNPAYGYLISMLPSIDLYVLHFIRDARAVAYSWSKRKPFQSDSENPEYMPRRNPIRSAMQWNARNSAAELWLRQNASKYMTLRYEDFVQKPKASVISILEFMGEKNGNLPFISDQRVALASNHSVFGNVVRFQTGNVQIKMDSEWQNKMSSFHKTAVTLLTLPLLFRYGYLK